MWRRVVVIARAHLAGEWFGERGARFPYGPLLMNAFLSAALCGVVRSEVGCFAYALIALSLPLALTAIPLLGELGPLLRADPAADWIGAQPARPVELRAGRVLTIAVLLGGLAASALVPAALLAPGACGVGERALLLFAGLAQTYFVAAGLLWVQALLGERAEGLLVVFQTLLFCGVLVGMVLGLRLVPAIRGLDDSSARMLALPPAWFASLVAGRGGGAGGAATALALATLPLTLATFALAPFPPASRARRTGSPLATLLAPFRALATRAWVRRGERGLFDLVYDALPAERDFVLRAYPLVAVPLAFLLLGAEPGDARGEGLLALLSFTPAIYAPVLLVHVPATATPRAQHLVATAPLDARDAREGALKAVWTRFLFPLYLALGALTWSLAGLDLALRLTLPAAAFGLWTVRITWDRCASAPPLSRPVDELQAVFMGALSQVLFSTALVHAVLAIAVQRFVTTPLAGAAIAALALAGEAALRLAPRRASRAAA